LCKACHNSQSHGDLFKLNHLFLPLLSVINTTDMLHEFVCGVK